MSESVSQVVLGIFLALALLILPGIGILRLCLPQRDPDLISRLTLAPGVTVALSVLLFLWCDVFGLKLLRITPWLLIGVALVILSAPLFGSTHRRTLIRRVRRTRGDFWLAGATLILILVMLLVVRFRSTWAWIVPPGFDSAQHTIIVQLLLDHSGLFQSWMPYSDSQTFSYHFGFHAVTALFAWMSGSDAAFSVLIMGRVMGACAAAALFALVRLWTRNVWGGVFAVAIWILYSRQLYSYDDFGRWTLLTGLTILPVPLVLLSKILDETETRRRWRIGLLCAVTIAGLALAQYKTLVIFAALASALVGFRLVAAMFAPSSIRVRQIGQILVPAITLAAAAFLLMAPRLPLIMQTKTGRQLNRIVFDASPPNPNAYGAAPPNAKEFFKIFVAEPRRIVVSTLLIFALLAIASRRPTALWFAAGWIGVCVLMSPNLIGINRAGLIDMIHWKLAAQTAVAVLAGLTIALVCERMEKQAPVMWNALFFCAALALSFAGIVRNNKLPALSPLVLREDIPVLDWIAQNVPSDQMIAGRGFFINRNAQAYDAMAWVPYFTRHLTNTTNLAATMERSPPGSPEKRNEFTRSLYQRDMSTQESAAWMKSHGFAWFYVGAVPPERQNPPEPDQKLLKEIAGNPSFRSVASEGAARLYHVD